MSLTDLTKKTEGMTLFILTLALTLGSVWCLGKWWQAFSLTLITGFIGYAQDSISDFYEHPNDDPWNARVIAVVTSGYAVLFVMCILMINETAGALVFGGFINFIKKVRRETMADKVQALPNGPQNQ